MSSKYEYGIITENELLSEHNKCESINNKKTVFLGQIVKVDAILKSSYAVRLLKDGENWDTTTYICPAKVLISVDEKLLPFLSAIPSPQEKIKLARDKARYQKLLQISVDMVVGVSLPKDVRLGTVKFIGNVKGIGKSFGIQLHVRYCTY